jgi:hypothetical protein
MVIELILEKADLLSNRHSRAISRILAAGG